MTWLLLSFRDGDGEAITDRGKHAACQVAGAASARARLRLPAQQTNHASCVCWGETHTCCLLSGPSGCWHIPANSPAGSSHLLARPSSCRVAPLHLQNSGDQERLCRACLRPNTTDEVSGLKSQRVTNLTTTQSIKLTCFTQGLLRVTLVAG